MNFIFILISASILLDRGVFRVGSDGVSVSVNEGDSVTLNTGGKTNQQEKIKWYFHDTRIAQINGDLSCICTDVQCNEGTERFRDRLKLDHQTGSLTIRDIRFTDSGEYELKIIGNNNNDRTFNVSVCEMDKMKTKSVKEGEYVIFDPGKIRKPNDVMTWYFNDTCIAEITRDQSKICTDEQCEEKFRDRLKLDYQTGSLTITNTRNTDSGDYRLQIISNNISIIKSFAVALNDSHVETPALNQSLGVKKREFVLILLPLAMGTVIYCLYWKSKQKRLKFEKELDSLTVTQKQREKPWRSKTSGDKNSYLVKNSRLFFRYDVPDERIMGRMKPDDQTTTTDSRVYHKFTEMERT